MKTLASAIGIILTVHVAFAQISTKQIPASSMDVEALDNVKFLNNYYAGPPESELLGDKPESGSQANCNVFSTLVCGQTYKDQVINAAAGNDFTINDYNCLAGNAPFSGYDLLYKVTITQKSSVHFIMDILNNADFDMFLLTSCSPANCYAFSIEYNNPQDNIYREVLDVNLNPGTYYLVIDAYDTSQQGTFNLTMNCSCSCVETVNDEPYGHKIFCDGFEDYVSGKALTPQGTRWLLWDRCSSTGSGCTPEISDDANVITDNGNKTVRVQQNGTTDPDLVYLLDNQTTGRWRLSWKMKVATNKAGYYNLLHTTPNADGGNAVWADEVFFNTNGSGYVEVANNSIATFNYPANKWFNVVNIVDLVKDSAQLWIDGEFVTQWKFSLGSLSNGSPTSLKRLAGANFYAVTGSDYYIDDICFWGEIPSCTYSSNYDPVCIENGTQLSNEGNARCKLYTSEEWNICNSVCDYGGTFIYRGETYSGSFDLSDKAPSELKDAPCVKAAYGGNVPSNLSADIYIYYQDPNDISGNQIDLQFNNNGNAQTKCFVFVCSQMILFSNEDKNSNLCKSGQFCWLNSDIGNGVSNLALNSCSNFYYLVVTGLPGAAYSNLIITPNGKCPSNPKPLACGDTKNDQVSASQNDAYFSVPGNAQSKSAYQQCYTGVRTYNGGEQFFKFTLTQQTTITLTMSSSAQMGMFLYAFVCGSSCIAYAENTAITNQAVITQSLPEGSYYVIIDKNGAGPNTFSLSMTCNPQNNFQITYVIDDGTACPTNTTQVHQVAIPQTAYDFDANDLIYFLYRDNSGLLTSSNALNNYWPGLPITYFNIQADLGNDTVKCSYVPNDSFFVHILQTEPGKRTHQKMLATFAPTGPGITGGAVFKPDSVSLISKLKPFGNAINFSASTGSLQVKPDVTSVKFVFSANKQWTVVEQPPASWLTVTPTTSNGAEEIELQLQPSTLTVPRSTVLFFYSNENPDLYRQFVKVEQLGICVTPSASISPGGPITTCSGQPVTLMANTGSQPADLFKFNWSTGETTQGITVPTGQSGVFTYAVTLTNSDCFTTASATVSVTVNALPALPTNPQNKSICAGASVPPLSVTVPGGIAVDWYNQPTGGQAFLSNSTTYVPPAITMTYYTQARNGTTGCVSASRTPVTLTVNPVPNIQITDTICAANNLTYQVSLTTVSGTTVSASAGLISGGNGNFNIINVPAGQAIQITATIVNTGCSKTINLQAPSCGCPPVALPTANNTALSICQGGTIPALSVMVGPNQTADWYDSNNNLLLQGSLTYTPSVAGDYFVRARDLSNGCVSTLSTKITLTINPLPTLVFSDTLCAPDLNSYALLLNTTGNQIQSSVGTVSGTGTVTINNIPKGVNPTVTAQISATGCQLQQTFFSPTCPCPVVSTPAASTPIIYCQGAPIPVLSVTVGQGETADWYAQSSGGQLLATGSSFQPALAGTYYVAARQLVNGCVSPNRVPVVLEEKPSPFLTILNDTCESSLIYYKVIVSTNGNLVTALPYSVENDGNGIFTIIGIPTGTAANIKASFTATGCSTTEMVLKNECLCPQLSAPVSGGNKTICAGDNIPFLTVEVNPGETTDWYDEFNTLLLVGDTAFLPPGPGTYYARARQLASGCTSASKTDVQLIVKIPPTAYAGKDTIICANGFVALQGQISGASSATWTASVPGGQFGNANALNTSYTPPAGFSSLILTLTTNGLQGPCPATSDQMLLNINPLPSIQILDTICATNLSTYSIKFFSSNTQISIAPNIGVLLSLGNGQYQLDDVPSGAPVTITATSTLTGCSRVLPIPAPQCPCGLVQTPANLGNVSGCPGTSPAPALKVDPGPGNTTDWYAAASGGTVLPNGMNTNSFTPPAPGTYYAESRNVLTNCVSGSRTPVTLTHLPMPFANAGPNQLLCPGEGLTLTAANGPGYTFLWSTGATSNTITINPALPPGYSVTVSNSDNCTATATVLVTHRPAPTVVISELLPVLCHGASTGALVAGAQGGSGSGYTVLWSTGQTSAQILNIPAAAYSVTLTDGAGCKDTAFYTLNQPPALEIAGLAISNVPSPTSPVGSILVDIQGGTPPYSYQWIQNGFVLPGSNMAMISDLLAGTYYVKVKDANDCEITSDPLTISVVATHEPDWSSHIQVYPNPTDGIINIDFSLPEFANTGIMVYDAMGRLIQKSAPARIKDNIMQVNMGNKPNGIYLLRIDLGQARTIFKPVVLNK